MVEMYSAVQLAGITLVLRLGPEAGDAPPLVVGVERQVQADGVVDAADEAHARVGLLFHGRISFCVCIIASMPGLASVSYPKLARGPPTRFVTTALLHRLAPPFDTGGFRVHNIVIVGPAQQPDCPLRFQVLQPKFGISQPLGCVMPNPFGLGTRVDRPKQLGLLDS